MMQSGNAHDRLILSECRHDGFHAAHPVRSVQGFPNPETDHSAWWRCSAVSLGPLNNGRPELAEIIKNNIFFDTCVYHQPGINLLTEVVPADNILFASEMVGAVKGVDPKSGHYFDDTKRYIDKAPLLNDTARRKIFEGNAYKVFSRLKAKAPAAA